MDKLKRFGHKTRNKILHSRHSSKHTEATPAPVATPAPAEDRSTLQQSSSPENSKPSGSVPQSAKNIAWEGIKTTLRVVKESGDAFPPLKSTAGGLLALIDLFEVRLLLCS
jgi:hypothetical protein